MSVFFDSSHLNSYQLSVSFDFQISELTNELERLTEENREITLKIATPSEEKRKFMDEREKMDSEKRKMQQKFDKLQKTNKKLTERLEILTGQLETVNLTVAEQEAEMSRREE